MREDRTETLKPYEPPHDPYDAPYAYDDEPPGGRILWGRVAILGGALVLAFLIGRISAPDGADAEQIERLRSELNDAQAEIDSLQSQLTEPTTTVTPQPTTTPTTEPDTTAEGPTYTVQRGDTLRLIAQAECGDPEMSDEIMELNGITDPTQLSVGDTLTLPADCA